jgi:hypothetical protein
MPDERESAVAAWLDDPYVQRELSVTKQRFPDWSPYEVYHFTLGVLTYAELNIYGDIEIDPPKDDGWDNDATGWKP